MKQNILLIDDDDSFRMLLAIRIRGILDQPTIIECDSLDSARKFLVANKDDLDLVILDEHLSDGRGIEFLGEGWFRDLAVLSVSSDDNPEIPGASLKAGATYFLGKQTVSDPLFKPLIEGIIDRNRIQRELSRAKGESIKLDTVRKLVSTLRHEINNPLGAVLGAAYIMKTGDAVSSQQKEAAELVEASAKRIKVVLDQLCEAASVEEVMKADHAVFHIPGDKPWGK